MGQADEGIDNLLYREDDYSILRGQYINFTRHCRGLIRYFVRENNYKHISNPNTKTDWRSVDFEDVRIRVSLIGRPRGEQKSTRSMTIGTLELIVVNQMTFNDFYDYSQGFRNVKDYGIWFMYGRRLRKKGPDEIFREEIGYREGEIYRALSLGDYPTYVKNVLDGTEVSLGRVKLKHR